jgi:protein-S-isoprenylcysteine O-methyltransferase Ste14
MSNKTAGYLFVIGQFALLYAIFVIAIDEPTPPVLYYCGAALIVIGLGILLLAGIQLGNSLTANPVPKEKAQLVRTGLYGRVRHPIYTGLLIATFGSVVQQPAPVKIGFWILFILLIWNKAKFEERLLSQKFSDYGAYSKTTGRFFPRIGK